MSNWVDKFKKLVISSHKQHTIIADQDSLFAYEELLQAFILEGYSIVNAKTELEVRVEFELQVRGSDSKFLIIAPSSYTPLPDIEMEVNFQSIGLSQVFPNLNSRAIKGLSFNALCLLSNIKPYEELSHGKTLKFLLENLYNIDFDTLTNSKAKERVLNALITVLIEKDDINKPLLDFLVSIARPYYPTLISKGLSKQNLIDFIQEQWLAFVTYEQSILDFKEPLLIKSLGYLFAFDNLKQIKVPVSKYNTFPPPLKIGLHIDEEGHIDQELEGLMEHLKQHLETIEDIPDQWFKIVPVLANGKLKCLLSGNEGLKANYQEIENKFNIRFQRFIDNTYGSLFSLSGVRKPVVVTRILEHLNARAETRKTLLVIDGMNYWQWQLLSGALSKAGIKHSPGASLAFIPSITAWSRQAIFRGDKPALQEDNSKEAKLFEEYWTKRGVPAYQIDFKKFGISEPFSTHDISRDTAILGLVCNDLDNIMHGSILGNYQLKTSTEQWIEKSNIVQLIAELRTNGFQIHITADHGNIEASGIKNLTLKEKVGALSRGKRHICFTNETLLTNFVEQNIGILIGKKGLSVYLKHNDAFTTENTHVITHGGSHLWEVIVPFISINE
ncbi:BREX-3 system phosphatase PglZ [Pedobacter sp. SYSU D00535]|uniref:BREX-3 system phosphatase PglZ n=1 Tax=Pedobacter sp. SYSU D00535 TaxID=2810308 RepID=UPI001A979895|nr:BREX-3 system phosphatase PglZ [Pedobacter sp. SYSU D00535]